MKIKTLQGLLLIVCIIFGELISTAQIVDSQSTKAELLEYHLVQLNRGEHHPDQLIVKFSEGVEVDTKSMTTGLHSVNSALSSVNTKNIKQLFNQTLSTNSALKKQFGLSSFYLLELEEGADLKTAMSLLSELNEIEMVEPNYLAQGSAIPNDPLYNEQWALNNTGQAVQYDTEIPVGTPGCDLSMEAAWDLQTGSGDVVVCILDSGVDTDHPEYATRIVPGYDFQFNDDDPNPIPGESGGAHGTACAGIVGASGNNGAGVAGIAWETKIMPVKVLYNNSGSWEIIANGITWAADNGADIISMSIQGSSFSTTLETAVNYAFGLGCTLFAAAGNFNNDLSVNPSYPGSFTNTICVGALSPCEERKSPTSCDGENWWGSNYGSDLDFLAPGTRNYTTDISGSDGYDSGDYYPFFNGTSSACPHAAGVAALMLAQNPMLTNTQIRTRMQMSCVDMGSPGKDDESGWGRIDAYQSLMNSTNDEITLKVIVSKDHVLPGEAFSVDFYIENVVNLASYEITCSYEPDYFDYAGYELGEFVYSTGRTILPFWFETDPDGYFYFKQQTSGLEPPGPDGNGRLFTVDFIASDTPPDFGNLQFNVTEHNITQPDGTPILPAIENGSIFLFEGNYCTSGLYTEGCSEGDYLDFVLLADLENAGTGCSENDYGDFTSLIANVSQGQVYDLTLEVGYADQFISAWIDYNDDGWFGEDEKVVDDFYIENPDEPMSTEIFIIDDAPVGEHRMRLRTVWDTEGFGPCDLQEFGEIEDYTLNVLPPPEYCTSGLYGIGCVEGDYFDYVSFANLTNENSGCSENSYGDYTHYKVDVVQGSSHNLSVEIHYDNQYVSAWVDFNDDYVFDISELVVDDLYYPTASTTVDAEFYIPSAAPPGEHRMRLRTVWNIPDADACSSFGYGEVEDYTISVLPQDSYGNLEGNVYDAETLNPIENCVVQLESEGITTETNRYGHYYFAVQTSPVDLTVSVPGYEQHTVYDITVVPGATTTTDFYLDKGYCSQDLFEIGCEDGDGIDDFFFVQIEHPESGCSENGYGNFTDMTAIVAPGSAHILSVSTGYADQYLNLWVDMNDDFIFDDTERILENTFIPDAFILQDIEVTIPPDAIPGNHRMRARMNYNDPFSDPCGFVQYGEVHDYTIEITGDPLFGNLQGTVMNWDDGMPVSGVEVLVPDHGLFTTSGPGGDFLINNIPAGPTDVLFNKPDFFPEEVVTDIQPGEPTEVDVELKPLHLVHFNVPTGWSGVSSVFYVDASVENIFSGPGTDGLVILQSQDGVYYPGENINTIGQWENNPGYKIKTESPLDFYVAGWTRKPAELELFEGWNILPCWSDCPIAIGDLFASKVIGEPVIVKEIAGPGIYWPDKSIYTLNTLQPGNAYMINMDSEATVVFPGCVLKSNPVSAEYRIENNTTWNDPKLTANNHLIHIAPDFVADAGLTAGDYIGAFDVNDNCFGMVQVDDAENYAIAAFADDQLTSDKDGFTEEELILLKAFISGTGETIDLDVEFDLQMPDQQFYNTDGMSSAILKSTGISDGLDSEGHFVNVYPNPGNGLVNIQTNGDLSILAIDVFDNYGKLVYSTQVANTNMEVTQVDLQDLPSGFYSIKMITNASVIEEKIIIQ